MSLTTQPLEICVEQPASTPRSHPGDHPPAFVSGVRDGQYRVEAEEAETEELLPAYSGPLESSNPLGRKPCQARPFVRYISAALSLILIVIIIQLSYCYLQLFHQLSQADASLALADKRGYALAARVAWLEDALEFNGVQVLTTAVSSASPGELDPIRWRETVDLAITATELQDRADEMQEALVWCHAVKGGGAGSEERRKEVFG